MRGSKALSPLLTGLTLVALSGEAFANPGEEIQQPPQRHRSSEILMRMEEPRSENGSWLDNVGVRKGVGLVYRHNIQMDPDHKVVLSVGGPAIKKERLGLMFEVRF
jgi:hypothetical protein